MEEMRMKAEKLPKAIETAADVEHSLNVVIRYEG